MPIDLLNFVRKWNASTLTERSAAPQHFRDLCEVLDVPHPTQTDEIGANSETARRSLFGTARSLVSLRDNWLNPTPAPGEPPIPKADLKKRTLTNLYNQRPT